ncbi:MAG: hydroxyacid dehydrogenase [Nitrososphaerota archaeon]|nr:hydroxyacid dehydrogenase [Nitrososphaerota archaeon]
MVIKILVSDKIVDEGIKILQEKGYEVTKGWDIPKSDLSKVIDNYDCLIVRSATKVRGELLDNAKKLKVIGRAGEGLDNVDFERAKQLGIALVNTPHVSCVSVAELTVGHLIALARNIVQSTNSMQKGKWEKDKLMGTELSGKTLGIIGYGFIGKNVEHLALSLGMEIIVVEECVQGQFVSLSDMLPQADFITLHVPLTSKTHHLISVKEFSLMKNGVCIIDCSRGGVMDQEALYQALQSGKVAGAALDVFEEEPPIDKKLLTLPTVIATPHMGAQTFEAQQRASIQIAHNVIDAIEKLKLSDISLG